MRGDWTATDFDKLAELAAQGLSASAIGEHLGRTRNSVIGYARRHFIALTFKKSLKPGEGAARRRIRQALYARVRRAKQRSATPKPYTYKPRAAPMPSPPKPKPVERLFVLTIYDLKDGLCKYPSNEEKPPYRYCGQRCDLGTSWCNFHAGIVFNPQPLRRLRAA